MSRKSLSRGTRGVALLVGLAGFAVSTAWPAGAALAADPDDTATTTVATASAQAVPPLAGTALAGTALAGTAKEPPTNGPDTAEPIAAGSAAAGSAGVGQAYVATAGYQAVSVTVERTRGKHNQSIFQVSGGAKQAGAVLRLASSRAFLSLRPHYLPPSKAGRYRYEVKVHYRNGSTKKVVTWSNTPGAPRVLFDVIRGVETMPAPSFPPGFPFTGGFPIN